MKTLTPAMTAHLAQDQTTLATCWKVKRRDGLLQGFTEHDGGLTVDLGDGDGALLYESKSGFTRTAIEQNSAFKTSKLDLIGLIDSAGLSDADLRAGKYDFAEIKIFLANWQDTSAAMGVVALLIGQLDQVSLREGQFTATLRDLLDRYNATRIVELHAVGCRADLGDGRCKVQLDPPLWTASTEAVARPEKDAAAPPAGSPSEINVVKPTSDNDRHFVCVGAGVTGAMEPSWNTALGAQTADGGALWQAIRALTMEGAQVAGVTDNRRFAITYAGDAPDGWFDEGVIRWTGGLNSGLRQEVKSFVNGSPEVEVTLYLAMPLTVQPGDAFVMTAGCSKGLADPRGCVKKFDNLYNFRGEPFSPINDRIFALPDLTG